MILFFVQVPKHAFLGYFPNRIMVGGGRSNVSSKDSVLIVENGKRKSKKKNAICDGNFFSKQLF